MIGQTISHYTIIEKLGEGGMGVVYKAQDTTLDRMVALKFLPSHVSASDEVKARFLQEAKAAAALNHAHICTVHGVEDDGTRMFIVMEYIDGGTLRDKIPFARIDEALTAAIQICEALQEAHAHGIVHRDIKADNIMLTSKGQIKVMDFGLAKLKGSLKLTRTSSTVGTLAYMAPEQIQGGEVDSRSDIFSFGVLLFEMVTGKTPYRGEHQAAMMYSLTADSKSLVTTEIESNSTVWTVPANGAGKPGWNAAEAKEMTSGKDDGVWGVTIAPDGRVLYSSTASGLSQIWVMDANGNNPRQLTSGEVPAAMPQESPDGKFIVFLRSVKNSRDLWRMNSDGANPVQLTHGDFTFSPSFTPDSKWVVYSRVKDGKYNLWKIGIDGGAPVQITQKHSHTVSVSHDGKYLVCEYQENEAGTTHTMTIMALETGAIVKSIEKQEYYPILWMPDDKAFAVVDPRDGVSNLWAIPINGGKDEQLTHFKNNKLFAVSIARDGKSLAVARGPVVSDVIMINDFR
jgi:serine/threonine protein kinase